MNVPSIRVRILFAIGVIALCAATASAQKTEDDPPFKVSSVKIEPMPDLFKLGKAATFHGTIDDKGHGFELGGLGMLNPVAITLISDDPKQVLSLRVGKTWKSDDRSASTDAQGLATVRFRTDDVAKIRVASAGGSQGFGIVIWVGDERTDYPDLGSAIAFGKKDKAKAAGAKPAVVDRKPDPAPSGSAAAGGAAAAPAPASSGTSPILYVIAGLLGALVILVAIVVLRRKK